MRNEIFTIPDEFYRLDDERVRKYSSGEITQVELMRLTRPEDPWEIVGGKMTIITPRINEDRKKMYIAAVRKHTVTTGGITPALLYENRQLVLKAYPEMEESFKKAEEIVARKKCKGCAINKEVGHLLSDLLAIPVVPERDLSVLSGKFTEHALRRLRNEEITIKDEDIRFPKQFNKIDIPVMPEAVPGPIRPSCLNCCRKHLSQAIILLSESKMGYPQHRWLAVGHLAEASEETLADYPEMAQAIREERLKMMDSARYTPSLMPFFDEIDALERDSKNTH